MKSTDSVSTDGLGTPILVRDIGHVQLEAGSASGHRPVGRQGQTVGGIVISCGLAGALRRDRADQARLQEIAPALPEGVRIVPAYDRSDLIHRAIAVLREKLVEESVIVSLIALVFLFHVRSALVAIFILPVAVLLAFIPMAYLKITSNIMSLGGIAIAIKAMVDAAIVMVENAHKRLEQSPSGNRAEIIIAAAKEVGRPLFFSLLVIAVSFLPIFAGIEDPAVHAVGLYKTFSMLFATALSVTLAPVLMVLLIRGKVRPEAKNPLNRWLIALYRPILSGALRVRWVTLGLAIAAVAITVPVFRDSAQNSCHR
ncbi:MAG: efflux RND transporter permease subunit [Nitrospiraceae bacterium]